MATIADIKKKLSQLDHLPTLPLIVTELLNLLDNPKSTPKEINELIRNDQSLTTKTLKMVNSSYYGFPREISTVTEAVVILGFDTVRNLALSVSLCKMFKGGGGFDKQKLWEHTIAVAFASKIIAKAVKYQDDEIAFVAGLLHDIAKVFEDQFMHDEFVEAVELSKNQNLQLHEAEDKIIGYNHGNIGKYLSELWNLPKPLMTVIAYHHDAQNRMDLDHAKLNCIVNLADSLVRFRKIGDSGNYGKASINTKVLASLKLKKDDLAILIKRIVTEIEMGELFLKIVEE